MKIDKEYIKYADFFNIDELSKKNETHIENNVNINSSNKIGKRVKLNKGVKLGNNAVIQRCATIGEGSIIGNNVVIGEFSTVGTNCIIPDNLVIDSNSIIDDHVDLTDNINITGCTQHPVNYLGNGKLKIGCLINSVDWFIDNYQSIGEDNNYTPDEIQQYKNYIDMAKEFTSSEVFI